MFLFSYSWTPRQIVRYRRPRTFALGCYALVEFERTTHGTIVEGHLLPPALKVIVYRALHRVSPDPSTWVHTRRSRSMDGDGSRDLRTPAGFHTADSGRRLMAPHSYLTMDRTSGTTRTTRATASSRPRSTTSGPPSCALPRIGGRDGTRHQQTAGAAAAAPT